jgi:hypothetical protein
MLLALLIHVAISNTPAPTATPTSALPPDARITMVAASTPTQTNEGPSAISASDVIAVDNATKDQLYSAALTWTTTAFKSGKATTDLADSIGGRIIVKPEIAFEPASFIGGACTRGVISYTMTIAVKDGRYKYEIGSFVHSYRGATCDNPGGCNYGLVTDGKWAGPRCASSGADIKNWLKLQALAQSEIQRLVSSLKPAMAKAASDNW